MSSRREFIATILAGGVAIAACTTDRRSGSSSRATAPPPGDLPGMNTAVPTGPPPPGTTTIPPGSTGPVPTGAVTTSAPGELPVPHPPPHPDADEPIIVAGMIEIPRIALQATMYEGVSMKVLGHGPGHWPGSAGPGQRGNMVIGGHRVTRPQPFRDIDRLEVGDEVVVGDGVSRSSYRVTSTEIVTPDAMWIIDPTPAPTATLFACHPKGSTRQRIVVRLELDPTGGDPGGAAA